jgi:hypothetical protein
MGVRTRPESPRRAARSDPQIEQAVLRTVAYADVFDYPLYAREVHRYLHGTTATLEATDAALARCTAPGGALSYRDGFYTLQGRESLVTVRDRRAAIADRLWPAALRFARLIAGLPFVRMVAVTGSLAWHNVDDGGDIDYLIVTTPGRLWVCRWLIAAVGRVARLDGVSLCPNYVISTRALALADHNLYTAYEVARMTPIAGIGMYRRLRRANPWVEAYLPNAVHPPRAPERAAPLPPQRMNMGRARFARLTQRILESPLGALLERWEMKYRIRKRLKLGNEAGEAAYGIDCCKCHVSGHARRTLAAFAERVAALEAGAP